MLSVIVACRNNEKWLPNCIESLQLQADLPVEIIICFDADFRSYSHLKNNLSSFNSVKMFATEFHVGCYRARNVALQYAEGEYISFCDSDDAWSIYRAREMVKESVNSCSDVVNTFYSEIDEDGNKIRDGFKGLGGVFCYKRSLIMELGGFEPWICSADSDLYYRAKKYGAKDSMVKDHLYFYRQHESQLTRSPSTKFGSVRRKIYESRWHDDRVVVSNPIADHRELKP